MIGEKKYVMKNRDVFTARQITSQLEFVPASKERGMVGKKFVGKTGDWVVSLGDMRFVLTDESFRASFEESEENEPCRE